MRIFGRTPEQDRQGRSGASESRSRKSPAANLGTSPFFQLQRTIGNQAVSRILETKADGLKSTVKAAKPATVSRARLVPTSGGAPLDPKIQRRYEKTMGVSFSGVRIHSDADSALSADAIHAEAYTVGRDIVFGAGRYQPESAKGERLLAHELAHVVQQRSGSSAASPFAVSRPGDASEMAADRAADAVIAGRPAQLAAGSAPRGIYRQQTPQVGQTGPGAEAVVQIRQWLEEHQFAPPQEQPQGEQHVLLNGQDMTLTQAVRLAANELHRQPDEVRPIIVAALARQWPYSARGASFVSPGNLVPGLPLRPQGHEDEVRLGKATELATVDDWLDQHHFYQPAIPDPRGAEVMLDGQRTTIDRVADHVMAILGNTGQPPRISYLTREEVVVHLRRRYVTAPTGPATQMVVGYTLVPRRFQGVTGTPDPLNPLRQQHQFSFTITRMHHTSDAAGPETSVQGTVTFDDNGNILNVQAGGQEAYVTTLLNGWIQVSGLVQVMVAANWSQTVSGTTNVSPALQVSAGAQVLVTPQLGRHLRLFNGHLAVGPPQVGLQALGGAQFSGQGVQGQGSVGIVINIPFDLP